MKHYVWLVSILVFACATVNLDHRVHFSRKGSKSQAVHGNLYVGSIRIPDNFQRVVYGTRIYVFFVRKQLWGKDGYHPVESERYPERTYERITRSVIEKGWYQGNARLRGTPGSWLYVEWGSGKGFVDPQRVRDMIRLLSIPVLPRSNMFSQG